MKAADLKAEYIVSNYDLYNYRKSTHTVYLPDEEPMIFSNLVKAIRHVRHYFHALKDAEPPEYKYPRLVKYLGSRNWGYKGKQEILAIYECLGCCNEFKIPVRWVNTTGKPRSLCDECMAGEIALRESK